MSLKHKRIRYSWLLAISLFTACGAFVPSVEIGGIQILSLSKQEVQQVKDSGLVAANNRFAFKLFDSIAQESSKENLLISPASASLAFFMTYHAASPEASSEIAKAFEIESFSQSMLRQSSELLMRKLVRPAEDITLEVANSLWVDTSDGRAKVDAAYLEQMKKSYLASVKSEDFTKTDFLTNINGWVAKQTHNKIPSILEELPPDEAFMYLINAIYFKAAWGKKFESFETHDRDFHLVDGNTKKVKMMRQFNTLPYFAPHRGSDGQDYPFQAISLPYGKEGKAAMTLFLPSYGTSLQDVYKVLKDPASLDYVSTHSMSTPGSITLPKFKMSFEQDLIKPLQAMGLKNVFESNGKNNFPKLTEQESWISKAFQKSFIDVNEEGTEAAAVTVVETSAGSSLPQRQLEMVIDRPFFYMIRDNETGQILFIGQVTDPIQ